MEWETLLVPETLSADELESHEAIVSDYRNNMYSDETINLAAIDQKIEIEITDALLASEEIVIDKISNNDLFEYLKLHLRSHFFLNLPKRVRTVLQWVHL